MPFQPSFQSISYCNICGQLLIECSPDLRTLPDSGHLPSQFVRLLWIRRKPPSKGRSQCAASRSARFAKPSVSNVFSQEKKTIRGITFSRVGRLKAQQKLDCSLGR